MTDFFEGIVIGMLLGAVAFMVIIGLLHPYPFVVDCGCGAMSAMCGQCIHGGNLSAPVCGAFTGVIP